MTRRKSTVAIGGLLIGTAFAARGVRQRRNLDLQERLALITGGSRRPGMLVARELGALGAKVAIVARDEAELEQALNDYALKSRGIDHRRGHHDCARRHADRRRRGGAIRPT